MDKDTVFYMVAGKRIGLARLHHAKYVSPAKGEHAAAVGARLSRSSRLSLDTAVPGAHLVVRGDRAKLEEVRSYRDVRSTRSAFRDPDGLELVLTDEVLVSFAPDVPVARRRRLCDTYSCVPIEEDGVYRTQFFGHRLTLRRPA